MSDRQRLSLDLGPRSYDILIGPGLIDELGELLSPLLPGRQVAVISNETVAPLYLQRTLEALNRAGFNTLSVVLPDGERYKDWTHLQRIFDVLIENRFERTATLLALGGGVIGDMTGFAAATFLRGATFVQVPTTLLSQVDASVGGKTGINHPLGKNLIGAFHQPRLVAIDVSTLQTLPRRELLAGMAEVIKYGIIWDADFFALLEREGPEIFNTDGALLSRVIRTCCAIKAEVVARDERESGTRALLNLGHTFGHAIESLAGYGTILHGEGVSVGIIMAADLSQQMGLCSGADVARIRNLLQKTGLPISAPRFTVSRFLEAMSRDKKVSGGDLRFVLVEAIGRAAIHKNIPTEKISRAIENRLSA